jgi:hypothetical protein
MCMCIGKSQPASSPACSTIFANPNRVNGAARSVTNTCRPSGVTAQLPQRPHFVASERVRRRYAILLPGHVDQSGAEIDLIPPQFAQFRHPEPVARGHPYCQRIAMPIPPAGPGGARQHLDLGRH